MKLDEIQKRYNISANELEEIKTELRKRLKECHPDNNVDFDRDYFWQLKEDLDNIEKLLKEPNSNALIPVNDVAQVISEVVRISEKRGDEQNKKEKFEKELSVSVDNQILMIKKRRRVFKYSPATILAIITFLWLFPQQVVNHPIVQHVFGKIIVNEYIMCISVLWLLALGITSLWWLKVVKEERIEKEIANKVKLESVQNKIFMNFLKTISPEKRFTKLQFMKYLSYGRNLVLPMGMRELLGRRGRRFRLQEEVVQNMADIILLRAKEYGMIKTLKSRSLIERYEVISDEE